MFCRGEISRLTSDGTGIKKKSNRITDFPNRHDILTVLNSVIACGTRVSIIMYKDKSLHIAKPTVCSTHITTHADTRTDRHTDRQTHGHLSS